MGVALVVSAIGALNWGTAELGYNLVNMLFGSFPNVESAIYYVVGVSGLVTLYSAVMDYLA